MSMMDHLLNKNKDYKICFSTPEGKRVLKDLLQFCKYRDSSFVAGDPNSTAFNEGMRRVALRLIKFINMNEDEITKISNLNS